MSAMALDLYQRLRESGMGEDSARKAAEALDSRFAEAKRESERHAERAAQDAAEKVRAGTVAAEEYHRRMENTPTRAENETEYAKLREDNQGAPRGNNSARKSPSSARRRGPTTTASSARKTPGPVFDGVDRKIARDFSNPTSSSAIVLLLPPLLRRVSESAKLSEESRPSPPPKMPAECAQVRADNARTDYRRVMERHFRASTIVSSSASTSGASSGPERPQKFLPPPNSPLPPTPPKKPPKNFFSPICFKCAIIPPFRIRRKK